MALPASTHLSPLRPLPAPPGARRLPASPTFRDYVEEFVLGLESAGRSPRTADAYAYALSALDAFLRDQRGTADLDPTEDIRPLDIERWLAERRRTISDVNAAFVHRHAKP